MAVLSSWQATLRLAAVALFAGVLGTTSGASEISWTDLPDKSVQVFEDPYRGLAYDQLATLRTIAQLRTRLTIPKLSDQQRSEVKRQLADALQVWKPTGIDPVWLIEQRWVVADRRERAGTAGNPDLDGKPATLSGFVIPAPADADGRFTAYLVPERGMCSHMPPPPPNQLLQLVFDEAWYPRFIYEPIEVSGQLQIAPARRTIRVVDGPVNMVSTFRLEVASIAPVVSSGGAETEKKPWPVRPHWTPPKPEAGRL